MFRVVILGSGASLPTLQRHPAAVAVQYERDVHLFDCGEGTQLQWRRTPLRFGRLRSISISHLHGDHLNGLVGLLQTLSLADRSEEMLLFGPPGLREYLDAVQRYQGVRFGYPVSVTESIGGTLLTADGYRIECLPLDHGVATLGYALVEGDRPGRFDLAAAAARGVPEGPEFGRLQRGESITLADGTVVTPEQVLGPRRPGRRVAYCVDTRPCQGAVDLAGNATLFLCDATFGSELRREAAARGHSTAGQAAEMALEAGAERLILTHISARYHDARPLLKEARELFPATDIASDLMEIDL
jgi:ribonuclease Z